MRKIVRKFFVSEYFFVLIILLTAFVLRVYGINNNLDFHFDQGRDAKVIWELVHSHKFFLIGPTTGLEGIFRGPFYYYLIAPFYWLGSGNPVVPSIFLILVTVAGIFITYLLGKEVENKTTGIIAAMIASFSYNIISASRWLSNPTPMLLLSPLLVLGMFKVVNGKKWGWPIIALVSGLSLFNFGSSGEVFYFFAIAIFIVWQWKRKPDTKNLTLSMVLFILTLAPLVIFDFKHGHILLNNIKSTFGMGSGSFDIPQWWFIKGRTAGYFEILMKKIFPSRGILENVSILITGILFLVYLPKFIKNIKIR